MNIFKTVILMTSMMVLILFVGGLLGGETGLIIAFIVSLLLNFASYWFSDRMVLRFYRGREISEADDPRYFSMVRRLASQAGLPLPKVYILPSDSLNAFATGRNPENAAVAVTQGLLGTIQDDELEGVIAHELAHIRNRDVLTATIASTLVGTMTFIARMAGWAALFGGGGRDRREGGGLAELALIIIAPMAAFMIQMAISRSREFAADAAAASITGRPLSLANALQKLENATKRLPSPQATPATAHLFIVNPLRGGGLMKLFSTHPPVAERIDRLHLISRGGA